VAITHGSCNLVLVEGGPKGQKRYKGLMLRRINWSDVPGVEMTEAPEAPGEEPQPVVENVCNLVWEGLVKQAAFRSFRFKSCPTEKSAREALGPKCEHFWDLTKNFVSGLEE
jgi:U4/U6 small nuclear ribonucleoprotein PRP3